MSTYRQFASAMRTRTGGSKTPGLIRDKSPEQQRKREAKEYAEHQKWQQRFSRDMRNMK